MKRLEWAEERCIKDLMSGWDSVLLNKGISRGARLLRASSILCSFCQGTSRKSAAHRLPLRKMITAVVTDRQLPPVASNLRASPWLQRHRQQKKKKSLQRRNNLFFCFSSITWDRWEDCVFPVAHPSMHIDEADFRLLFWRDQFFYESVRWKFCCK